MKGVMYMNEIINAISVVGFPTFMCCAMAYFVKYQCDNYRADIADMRKVVGDNTNVITKLLERIGDLDEGK